MAVAEGMRRRAEVYKSYNDAAILSQVCRVLPQIAGRIGLILQSSGRSGRLTCLEVVTIRQLRIRLSLKIFQEKLLLHCPDWGTLFLSALSRKNLTRVEMERILTNHWWESSQPTCQVKGRGNSGLHSPGQVTRISDLVRTPFPWARVGPSKMFCSHQ